MPMKVKRLAAIGCALLLSGCSENGSDTPLTETSSDIAVQAISETSAETTTEAVPETTTETSTEITLDETGEKLLRLIEERCGGTEAMTVTPKLFGDFDGDGVQELIAFAEGSDENIGLWFASGNNAEAIAKHWEWLDPSIEKSGKYCFLKAEEAFATASVSCYFLIKDSEPVPCIINSHAVQGLYPDGDSGDFTAIDSTYDFLSDGTGHTQKTYWLYYSPEDNAFYPYEGAEITENELKSIDGAYEHLEKALSEGKKLALIYRRDNGIININLREYFEGELDMNDEPLYENSFITLKISGNTAENITPEINEGYYLP